MVGSSCSDLTVTIAIVNRTQRAPRRPKLILGRVNRFFALLPPRHFMLAWDRAKCSRVSRALGPQHPSIAVLWWVRTTLFACAPLAAVTVFGGEQHTLTPHYVDPSGPRVNLFFALLPPDILHVLGVGQSTVFASDSRSRPPASRCLGGFEQHFLRVLPWQLLQCLGENNTRSHPITSTLAVLG